MQVINEDHYSPAVVYGAGKHTLDAREDRHALRRVRDPHARRSDGSRRTSQQVHALQDAIKVEQASPGKFEVPNWDQASQKKVRDALLVLGATLPDSKRHVRHQGSGRSGAAPDRVGDGAGAAIPRRTPSISTSRRGRTTARRSTGSRSRTCPSTASGRSASTTHEGYFETNESRRLHAQQPHREEGRRRLGHRAVRRLRRQDRRTACRSCRAGTTSCASIARGRKSSTAPGSSRRPQPVK